MKRNCSFIILIILLLTLTYTFSSTGRITETFTPAIKSSINRNKRRARYIVQDGFTQMKSFFS